MMEIEKTLTNEAIIQELLTILKQNAMKEKANDVFEVCSYIDGLEKKLEVMKEELTNVKQQLKDMQEDTILNNLKVQVAESAERLQKRCNSIKEQLFVVKDNIKFKAQEIVNEAKVKGKAALNKVSEFLGIKEKLVGIRDNVKESIKDVNNTIAKIDAFGAGMREANQKIANMIRTFADKEEVDYSQKEKRFSKTEAVKKPWQFRKKMLESKQMRLEAAIDKVDNLSRDVEINRMSSLYDNLMEKAHSESDNVSVAMVAETEFEYGADAFEAYERVNKQDILPKSEKALKSKGR